MSALLSSCRSARVSCSRTVSVSCGAPAGAPAAGATRTVRTVSLSDAMRQYTAAPVSAAM
jgi:hypothetical protein